MAVRERQLGPVTAPARAAAGAAQKRAGVYWRKVLSRIIL